MGSFWTPYLKVYPPALVQRYTVTQTFFLPLISARTTPTPLERNPPPATMAPRGKKQGPPKKDGRTPESLTDTPPLKGKPPVTKPQLKKKNPATGDSEGPPPSLASGTPPAPQPPHSYAAVARSSMDTSEPMDIEQLCTMRPQRSGTPPRSNQRPPPSAPVDNSPKNNPPDQALPAIPAAPVAAALPSSPPISSLAAAAASALPAAVKAATDTSAAGNKAGAALAGSQKTPLSATKTPLHQQLLQPIVKRSAAKIPGATAGTTAALPVTSTPTKAATPTPAAGITAKAASLPTSIGTPTASSGTATTTAQAIPALDPKAPISRLHKTYFDIQIPLTPRGELAALAVQRLCLEEFITSIRLCDESAVLLPFKAYYAQNDDVLQDPGKLGLSYTSISKYFQGFRAIPLKDKMFLAILVGYNSDKAEFYKNIREHMSISTSTIFTRVVQRPFIAKIGWIFCSHEHTDLHWLTEILENTVGRLNTTGEHIQYGLQFKNIWDGYKTPKGTAPTPGSATAATTPLGPAKRTQVKAVHVEVDKDLEDIATNYLHRALRSGVFRRTTNLKMKLVPVLSDRVPSVMQDTIRSMITKQARCLEAFEYVVNTHIDCLDEPVALLKNHSLRTLALSYRFSGGLKTFLSLDRNRTTGHVVLTYPKKYRHAANSRAHHLVKYVEYEMGTPALRWFNIAGLVAAGEMIWDAKANRPVHKSESELKAILKMEFDWLDCPDLSQADVVDRPLVNVEDLSVASFDANHQAGGKPADATVDDDSLATAPKSVSAAVDPTTAKDFVEGSGTSALVAVDVDADELASVADTVNASKDTPTTSPPPSLTGALEASQLPPADVDGDDLASLADTLTVHSDASMASSSPANTGGDFLANLAPADLDEDDLCSRADTIAYYSSSSSSDSSQDLDGDPPEDYVEEDQPATVAPPYDMVLDPPDADPDPVPADAALPNSFTTPLLSVGDQQQTLGMGPPTALSQEPSNPGSASADPGGWD